MSTSDGVPAAGGPDARTHALQGGLDAVRQRVEAACAAAGRDPAGITLVVVTKTYPADDVLRLASLGVRDVGESRDQEAAAKHDACAAAGLRWHFVGRLQSNKARSVAGYADVVHSLDRPALVAPLARGARAAGRVVDCLVQVSLDGDPERGGLPVPPPGVPFDLGGLDALADLVEAEDSLRLGGLMAVAPLGADPLAAFAWLRELSVRLTRSHPGAAALSAGMSGDLEAAVTCGATHLRVGSAILGKRPPLR